MPATPETILAFDFGKRRIGVAVGQRVTDSASPLGVVRNGEGGVDWPAIDALVREWRPARLIVGMPRHADGKDSEMTPLVEAFATGLARYGIPVETQDERYSSVEAEARLKSARATGQTGRITREKIDSAAATLIAERWLGRN